VSANPSLGEAGGAAAPVAVSVLTGFLGSGKTTLLNGLLRQTPMRDTAVLINEFGDTGLDHLLVERVDDRTVLLQSGCVCCTIRADLASALARLLQSRDRGDLPPFSRVVLETTGLADPAPVLHTLVADPLLAERCRLQGVVTAVDAVHGAAQLSSRFESVRQAAVADLLVVTKTDLAAPAAVDALGRKLARLNPGAPRIAAVRGELDAAHLLGLGLYDPARRGPDVRRWLRDEALRPPPTETAADAAARSRHGEAIRSFVVELDRPIARDALHDALEMLTSLYGDALLRVKGVVDLLDEPPAALHVVQHQRYPLVPLPRWPAHWDRGGVEPGSRRSRIVFVVQHLTRDYVSSLFAHFNASTDPRG